MTGLILTFCFGAFAQDMGFLSPAALGKASISGEAVTLPAPKSPPGPALEEQRLSLGIPVYTEALSGLSLTMRGQRARLGESLTFARAGVAIPREFGSADVGLAWSREDLAGNRFSASGSLGATGTRLLANGDSPVVGLNLVWDRKKLDHSWIYFLNYSNNRTFLNNIPIPGLAYSWQGKSYNAVVGLPFAFFMWRPDPVYLTIALSPFASSVDLGLRFWGPLQAFSSLGWSPRAYQLTAGERDRLIYEERLAALGLRAMFGPMGTFSIAFVKAFKRRFLYGEGLTDRDADVLELGDSTGAQIKWRLSF